MVDFCPFSQGCSYSGPINILKQSFLTNLGPIELKFHVKTPYVMLAKFYTIYFGHMTKMATTPIYRHLSAKSQ